jgi:hypothetical protein
MLMGLIGHQLTKKEKKVMKGKPQKTKKFPLWEINKLNSKDRYRHREFVPAFKWHKAYILGRLYML